MTPRSKAAQCIIRAYGSKVVVECLHCHNYHHTAALDGYIEQSPCQGSDTCTAMLCSACGGADEHKCGLCGLRACSDHMKLNYDAGAGNGGVYARICDICVAKLQEPPEPEGIQCSSCGKYSSEVPGDGRYWSTRDESTGYYDSGWSCQQCAMTIEEITDTEPVTVATAESEDESCPF